ncbi:MAG: hypothetical protein ACRDL5_17985, partial [Solirubrobacteraceae bacterium]
IDFGAFTEDAGAFIEEVGPEVLAAAADVHSAREASASTRRRANPARLVSGKGRLLGAPALTATTVGRINVHKLHRAPLPPAAIASTVHAALGLPVSARVGALLTTSRTLKPHERLSVIAVGLNASEPHAVQLILNGPNYHATRLVQVKDGVTGRRSRSPTSSPPAAGRSRSRIWRASAQARPRPHRAWRWYEWASSPSTDRAIPHGSTVGTGAN